MDETVRKLFGATLRQFRLAANLSQPQLARQVPISQASLSRYESGAQTIDPATAARLDELLNAGGKLLATSHTVSELDQRVLAQPGGASVLEPPWSITGTLQVLHEVARCAMDRRDFLIITGAGLANLGCQWGISFDEAHALPITASRSGSLSTPMLDRLDRRLADLRRLDDEFGGRELHHLAGAELRWLTRLTEQAVANGSDCGPRLLSLVTEAARLCGWLHFDIGHHSAAQSYYVAALRASASTDDALSGAHVLACMSWQATLAGQHSEAVSLIDAAEERVRHATAPRLRALLASRKARAHARAGDAAACSRALNDAERWLDMSTSVTEEPDWIYYFDHAELDAQAASCWVDLRIPGKARPLIDSALGEMSPRLVRDRTVYHARSAEAYFHANELEMACLNLHAAADLAQQTGSVHSIQAIRSARRRMARYSGHPRVQRLDRHLTKLVA